LFLASLANNEGDNGKYIWRVLEEIGLDNVDVYSNIEMSNIEELTDGKNDINITVKECEKRNILYKRTL